MKAKFAELAKRLAHSLTRRGVLQKSGLGLAGLALATLFMRQAHPFLSRNRCLVVVSCGAAPVKFFSPLVKDCALAGLYVGE